MRKSLTAVSMLIALFESVPVQAQAYQFTPLGEIGGFFVATDINDEGHVAGDAFFDDATGIGAFFYANDLLQRIGEPSDKLFSAEAINNNGEVVGDYDSFYDGFRRESFYYKNGNTTLLPTVANDNQKIEVVTINDSGDILFKQQEDFDQQDTTTLKSYIYRNGEFEELGSLGGNYTVANDMNNLGQVVGSSATADGPLRAFVSTNGVMQEIPFEENQVPWSYLDSYGAAINNHGHVVGTVVQHDELFFRQQESIFLYQGHTPKLIDMLGDAARPNDINDSGDFVGDYISQLETGYDIGGFIYKEGYGLVDMNTLLSKEMVDEGWGINGANAINNQGQIVGEASNTNYADSVFAYVLTPVPEPESYALLLSGLALINLCSRRKNKRN